MKVTKFYYFDEKNDDFSDIQVESKKIGDNYTYLSKNIFVKIYNFIIYYFVAIPIVFIINTFFLTGFIRNTKVINKRKDKKKGYFIYANHNTMMPDAYTPGLSSFPHKAYIVCNPGIIFIKGIRPLLKALGVLPVPSTKNNYLEYLKSINKIIEKGNVVTIYPEAHIWPNYNKIRDFGSVSFDYPVKLDAACFVKTTVFKKRKNGTVRTKVFLDGPVYPDKNLSNHEAKEKLRNEVYEIMRERCEKENSYLIKNREYIKVDDPNLVRKEIIKK